MSAESRSGAGRWRGVALGLTVALAATGAAVWGPATAAVHKAAHAHRVASGCPGDNGGITLSPGFCATVFADDLGHVRHMAFGPGGMLYVNTWSGRYYGNGPVPAGGFLIALKDTTGQGKADQVTRFGETQAQGDAGGTGVAVYKGYVYAEANDKIVRYRIGANGIPGGAPETVLSGMPLTGDHPMHPFIIDPTGRIFVDMGTATNACQPKNRQPGVPGAQPCTEKETRGGTWLYDADKLGQVFSPAGRYASGIRNGEGYAFDSSGRLYVTQHGRDQLPQLWPKLYPDVKHATELPAEEVVQVIKGADYGWPECYYDQFQKKLVLAPEYGGDGGKAVGVCAHRTGPVAAFPGHWGPMDMVIYKAHAFPAPYRGGMFIAFHGSWNRAPEPQEGYDVVYQPMADGHTSGPYVIFARGFAGAHKDPGGADHRPSGLAVGPDGALYIADDQKGRIWKVTYHGPANLAAAASAPASGEAAAAAPPARAPEYSLPVPPGSSQAAVAAGERIFKASSCTGCHGADAQGTPLGPSLAAGKWVWSDGSLAGLRRTIETGVAMPRNYRSPMPPKGGAQLTNAQLSEIAAYVWAVGHQGK
jgi:glucose/arabinose dehydrogenase/cytochrome c551/c552